MSPRSAATAGPQGLPRSRAARTAGRSTAVSK